MKVRIVRVPIGVACGHVWMPEAGKNGIGLRIGRVRLSFAFWRLSWQKLPSHFFFARRDEATGVRFTLRVWRVLLGLGWTENAA